MATTNPGECIDELLTAYRRYDRYVDIVSIFEMIFVDSQTDLPPTVAHFERYPTAPLDEDTVTPDFTVLFRDGTGIVGEVATIALHEGSVDSLCSQIGRYDQLTQLPDGDGGYASISQCDVLLLVPQAVGPQTVLRIIDDRLMSDAHTYSPSHPPVVAQFGYDDDRYNVQRLMHPGNGQLREDHRTGLGQWFIESGQITVRPARFAHVKAERAFMNDPIDPLYLAAHLWSQTFPTLVGETTVFPAKLTVTTAALGELLREQYGVGRHAQVRDAMALLVRGRLADEPDSDQWVVAWEELRVPSGSDVSQELARRACTPPTQGAITRLRKREQAEDGEAHPTLF